MKGGQVEVAPTAGGDIGWRGGGGGKNCTQIQPSPGRLNPWPPFFLSLVHQPAAAPDRQRVDFLEITVGPAQRERGIEEEEEEEKKEVEKGKKAPHLTPRPGGREA